MPDKDKREKKGGSYFESGRRKQRKTLMIIVPVVAAIIALAVVGSIVYKPTPVEAIDGVQCNTVEFASSINYHVHAHLDVFINGQQHTVPAQIGIPAGKCFFWLHTHTTDGVIHMEAPRQMNFTLNQFIDIWQQTQPDSTFSSALASGPVVAYVNGNQTKSYNDIQLNSREEIALVIGSPAPTTIPKTYPDSAPPT